MSAYWYVIGAPPQVTDCPVWWTWRRMMRMTVVEWRRDPDDDDDYEYNGEGVA